MRVEEHRWIGEVRQRYTTFSQPLDNVMALWRAGCVFPTGLGGKSKQ